MAQSLFKVLYHQQPTLTLDVMAPAWSQGLLERMPEVRNILLQPLQHGQLALSTRWKLGKELRERSYQQAIVLPNSWKSALLPFAAGVPQRTGFVGEFRYGLLNDARRLDKQRLPRTVQRFVALGLPQDADLPEQLPLPRLLPQDATATLEKLQITYDANRPLLALCPGAEYGEAKRWPAEYFAEVAQQKIAEGWQVWLFGSQKDHVIAEQIVNQADACVNLCGRTSLAEAVDLMALSHTVISNDSGLMHVAAALDRRLIALFGSSSPLMTPPLHPEAKTLYLDLECSPCFKRECPLGHLKCLKDLSPEQVSEALDQSTEW